MIKKIKFLKSKNIYLRPFLKKRFVTKLFEMDQ